MIDLSKYDLSRGFPEGFVPPRVPFGEDDWRMKAQCRVEDDAKLYAPTGQQWKATEKQASETIDKLCLWCPVMQQCGKYAIDSLQYEGVWGGMTPQELREKVRARFIDLALGQGIGYLP